jgi:hypothetical protein
VGDKSANKNDGYGLIGAFAFVFILKGVGNPFYYILLSEYASNKKCCRSSTAFMSTIHFAL